MSIHGFGVLANIRRHVLGLEIRQALGQADKQGATGAPTA